MAAYYNEIDPFAAAWLRELIKGGHIAPGDVDERDIRDVLPSDLRGYTQCHFFAGIGGWSYALWLAGWPDDRPVWTGSCPCQPFSAAGKREGAADERHLWPHFFHLISQCRPGTIFGEQVEAAVKHGWLDLVQDDLEGVGYAVGAHGLPACSVGAPHIRQRLWFVADRDSSRRGAWSSGVDQPDSQRSQGYGRPVAEYDAARRQAAQRHERAPGFWSAVEWIPCRDGKARPVEPASQCLANGISLAMGRLCSYAGAEEEEVIRASETFSLREEILHAVRGGNTPETVWREIGRRLSLPQATVLLSVLCKHSRELGGIFHGQETRGEQISETELRALRETPLSASRPSQGWVFSEQRSEQLADPLSKLSQTIPQLNGYNGSPLATKVPARVGRLRGYGNAIVPQVAAQFIEAYLTN